MTSEDQRAYDIVRKLFQNDYGEPFEMTYGQIQLFRAIYERQFNRTQFDCYTQYGKSDVVSMAILLRASTFQEKWIILGATKDKASIIMGKLIKHIFENDYTLGKFEVSPDDTLENIRRNKAKDNITFKVDKKGGLGQVITLSADARRKSQDAGDILIGHGGQNLIEDDAALIPDPIHGKALRMLGGHKDNFLLKITNSFGRNHAYRSAVDSDNPMGTGIQPEQVVQNPNFHRILIDYTQGLSENRLTQEYIDEMKKVLDPVMFGILYECTYPPADMVEDGGWMSLLTEDQVNEAQKRSVQSIGKKRLGVDIAQGTNFNAYVIRTDNFAKVKEKSLEKDLMKTADRVNAIRLEEHIASESTFLDAVGIGSGVVSRLHQMAAKVNGIKGGEKPPEKTETEKKLDPIEFYNLRAYMFWMLKLWVQQGGALEPHKDWMQLTKIRYKESADKKIQIMPKEEMRARSLMAPTESPDTADGLALTFAPVEIIKVNNVASPLATPFYPELGL